MKKEKVLTGTELRIGENNSYIGANFNLGKGWRVSADLTFIADRKGAHYKWWSLNPVNPVSGQSWIKENYMMLRLGFRYDVSFGRFFRQVRRTVFGTQSNPDLKVVQ